jgi:hypothetical protein
MIGLQRYQLLAELFVKDSAMLQSSLQVGLNNNVDIRYPLLKTELIINYQYIDDNNDKNYNDSIDNNDNNDKSTDNNDYRNRQKALKNVSELNLDNLYLSIETLKSIYNIPILKMNYNVYDFIMKERNIYTAYVMVRDSSSSKDCSDKSAGHDGVKIMVNKNTLDLFNVKYSIWIKSKSK